MSLTSRTNRWASRMIIVLQLATWNAVGVVLLHRGVSTLRRKLLETSYVVEADPPVDLESVVSSTRRDGNEYDLSTQRQSIDKDVEIIIQIDPERSSPHYDGNPFGLGAVSNDRFEVISEERRSTLFLADSLGVPTTVADRGTLDSRMENYLIDQRGPDNKVGKISRIVRNREDIFDKGKGISSVDEEENTITSFPDRSGSEIAGSIPTEKGDFTENATQATVRGITRGEGTNQLTIWTGKSNVRFSRVEGDSAAMAVALVTVGVIMLLIGPVVIILRILDERRQARKMMALEASAREDLPPTYEQAVLMDEAPRYSTLSLNYDRTPPPSPTLSATYTFSNIVT